MTILVAILHYVGASVGSGITWDILKEGGKEFIEKFKKISTEKNWFKCEADGEKFLKKISNEVARNEKRPGFEMKAIYSKVTDREDVDKFSEEFISWIKDNKSEFSKMNIIKKQSGMIKIMHQEAHDSSTINNAGIINNF